MNTVKSSLSCWSRQSSLLILCLSSSRHMADLSCLRLGRSVILHSKQHARIACRHQTVQQIQLQHRRGRCVRSSSSEAPGPEDAAQQPPLQIPDQQQPQQPQPAIVPPQQQAPAAPVQHPQHEAPQQAAAAKSRQQRTVVTPQPPIASPQQQQKQQRTQQKAAHGHKHHKQQQKTGQTLQQRLDWLRGILSHAQIVPASLVAFLAGGMFICSLLWGWARGSPIRKHNPYTFTMTFTEASKLSSGTPVRMKGVQIGQVNKVALQPDHVEAVAEVCDASNVIPVGSRVDVNILGMAADLWIDITPPAGCVIRKDHGPHHSGCAKDGLIVCNGGLIKGHQGGSMDYMTKFFLSQQDRTRQKTVDVIYHNRQAQPPPQQQ